MNIQYLTALPRHSLAPGLWAALLCLGASIASAQAPSPAATPVSTPAALNRITVSSPSCYGQQCPSYRVTLEHDGKVLFYGHRNTAVQGERSKQIDAAMFTKLQQQAAALKLQQLDLNYGPHSSHCRIWRMHDSYGGFTAEFAGDEPRHYSWYRGCQPVPAAAAPLQEFAASALQAANVQDWIGRPDPEAFKNLAPSSP